MDQELRDRIPILNFLFMMEVVLYHCESPSNTLAVNSVDLWCNSFITNFVALMGGPCMSSFFCVTGFLLFYGMNFHNYGQKLKKRVSGILVPYVLWQMIFLLKSILQGNHWTILGVVLKVFMLQFWPPLGAFWYLYAVFLLALISPLFLLLFRNEKIAGFIPPVLIVLLRLWEKYYYINFGYLGNTILYFPAYIIGCYLGNSYDRYSDRERLRYLLSFILLGVIFNGVFNDFLTEMTLETFSAALLFLFPVKSWMKNRRVYSLSFLILAIHQSVISVSVYRIRALTAKLIPYVFVSNLTGRIIGILLSIGAAAALRVIMKKFAPKTLNVLTGGRA